MMFRLLFVISEPDPVAPRVAAIWGAGEGTGLRVGLAPVHRLGQGVAFVRRASLHIHDTALADDLASVPELARATVVFPSVHRSESGTPCLTVHPLGNLGPDAEVGGQPQTLSPAAPRLMTNALRRLAEAGSSLGLTATFEATHHGPVLGQPTFFAEIGFGDAAAPPEDATRVLARVLPELTEEPTDRVVVGIGGGHYVPHFTDLALRRGWAFGHLISRHSLAEASRDVLRAAVRMTPGAEGILYARAADAEDARLLELARRLRDSDAPARPTPDRSRPSASSRPSGT